MIGESNRPKLAGIRPAPLCREDLQRSKRMMMASSLPSINLTQGRVKPVAMGEFKEVDREVLRISRFSKNESLVRLGMFKSANDAKSRFIHKHMRSATSLAQRPREAGAGGGEGIGIPLPRHWGGPPGIPLTKVSSPLAVTATEAALEDYRRSQRLERKRGHSSSRARRNDDHASQSHRSGASTSTRPRISKLKHSQPDRHVRHNNLRTHHHHHHDDPHDGHQQKQHRHDDLQHRQQNRPPSTHAVILPQGGGLVLVGEDGVRKSKFPRGCEQAPTGARAVATPVRCKARGDEDILERLCDPKHFTGTAATGHLPTVVDLEGGVGVLLKGASIAVKDHIGAQEVSWRLRLAERL